MAPNKLILLCDGTWCGGETNTKTNIHLLAEMIGCYMDSEPALCDTGNVKARYAHGVGLGSTFLNYILDGAMGLHIDDECKDAYQFIVENYTREHEIWMFGLSRGAYTVRSVAGMINNCGIIKLRRDDNGIIDHEETRLRCDQVYETYRSQSDWARPQSKEMIEYRRRNSHAVRTPVKFMGLFDTVGNLGIPKLTPRKGFVWPETFYDKKVSSVVENVYHAVSTHDRLSAFAPCLAQRDPKHGNDFTIHEEWFPGTHYDICRQQFRFFPTNKPLPWCNFFSGTVKPNNVLSDLTLRWMLERIQQIKSEGLVVPDIDSCITDINNRLGQQVQDVGSGDVYDDLLTYLPFGHFIQFIYRLADIRHSFVREIGEDPSRVGRGMSEKHLPLLHPIIQLISWLVHTWSSFWRGSGEILEGALEAVLGLSATKRGLLALKDRVIPNLEAKVYNYQKPDSSLAGMCIEDTAQLNGYRYPSKTYEKFVLFQREFSGPVAGEPI